MTEYDEDLLYPTQTASCEDFTQEEQRFLVSLMVWSFSRLNSYYHCPHEWKMHYLLGVTGISSAMAQFGSFIHKILEKYFREELSFFDLPYYYEEHYAESVTLGFPYNKYADLAQKYYDQGLEYLMNFSWDLTGYDILGIEKELKFEYQGYQFIGYIDLLLRDKTDGKLIICDHKSAILKRLKNGGISKTDLPHFEEFKRQLYIYSHAVTEEYATAENPQPVKSLMWNMFRDGSFLEVPWKPDEYQEAMNWAVDTIHLIENETAWLPNPSQFYCRELCSQRQAACPYKQ